MNKAFLFLLLSASACIAQTAEPPITFRGAYIGQPLSDYLDCSARKPKSLKEGYKSHGKLCEGRIGVVERLKMHTRILGALVSNEDSSEEGESFTFEESRITRIKIYLPDESAWEKLKYDLTQKLGPPTQEIPQVYQNAFGARWEYDQGVWIHGNIVAFAGIKVSRLQIGNRPTTGGVELTVTDTNHAKLPSTSPSSLD